MKSINHIFTETMYLKKINDAGLCLMRLYTSYILFLLPLEYHLSLFCYTINQASLCGTTSVRDLHFQISGVFICSINNISPGMVVVITLILPQCTLCIGFQLLFTHVRIHLYYGGANDGNMLTMAVLNKQIVNSINCWLQG